MSILGGFFKYLTRKRKIGAEHTVPIDKRVIDLQIIGRFYGAIVESAPDEAELYQLHIQYTDHLGEWHELRCRVSDLAYLTAVATNTLKMIKGKADLQAVSDRVEEVYGDELDFYSLINSL